MIMFNEMIKPGVEGTKTEEGPSYDYSNRHRFMMPLGKWFYSPVCSSQQSILVNLFYNMIEHALSLSKIFQKLKNKNSETKLLNFLEDVKYTLFTFSIHYYIC